MRLRVVFLFLACLGLTIASAPALTQTETQVPSDTAQPILRFNGDYARFRAEEGRTYLETYVSLPRSDVVYMPTEDGRFRAEFQVGMEVLADSQVVGQKTWRNVNHCDSLEEVTSQQSLFTLGYFELQEGEYVLNLAVADRNSDRKGSAKIPIKTVPFPDSVLCISDIQLAAQITSDTSQGQYTKGNYMILPNPSGVYGTGLPVLYFYAEIYNLSYDQEEDSLYYTVSYTMLSGDGQIAKSFPSRKKRKPGSSSVEVGGLNIITLTSGTYYFVLEVEDLDTGTKASVMKKFFVFREGEELALAQQEVRSGEGSPGLDADRYDVMTEDELDKEFETTRYVNSKEEREAWKTLNLEGKRNGIRAFWARMDPTPGTLENEYKQNYLDLVVSANNVFSGFKDGWKTDRGRVLLTYGRPDEIERFPFSAENKAYHVWRYFSIQGGVEFIFVDKREMGDFELVHSNARGELYDEDWTRWIDPSR